MMLVSGLHLRSRFFRTLAALIAAAAVLHADASHIASDPDAPASIGTDFEFVDDSGQLRSASSYAPAAVAVYFAYSSCPDTCSEVLAKLVSARATAGADADSFKVLFVTIDPVRDTRQVLREFLSLYGDGFIGARIPPSQLKQIAEKFGLHYDPNQLTASSARISQSESVFLFDQNGELALHLYGSESIERFASRIAKLVD